MRVLCTRERPFYNNTKIHNSIILICTPLWASGDDVRASCVCDQCDAAHFLRLLVVLWPKWNHSLVVCTTVTKKLIIENISEIGHIVPIIIVNKIYHTKHSGHWQNHLPWFFPQFWPCKISRVHVHTHNGALTIPTRGHGDTHMWLLSPPSLFPT